MTTFFIVFFCILCCAFVFQPLLFASETERNQTSDIPENTANSITTQIEAASQREAIADLELDFALGKLSNEEFNEQRKELLLDAEG